MSLGEETVHFDTEVVGLCNTILMSTFVAINELDKAIEILEKEETLEKSRIKETEKKTPQENFDADVSRLIEIVDKKTYQASPSIGFNKQVLDLTDPSQ